MNNKLSDELLNSGLKEMGICLSADAVQKLLSYAASLAKWSKAYNLTTLREPEQIISQHILDSLTVLPFLQDCTSVLDVGTGAGLPGIPLAIARPDISFKLLDSQQKKINFVQHVVTSLLLTNVSAVHQRVELLPDDFAVDLVISRAFSSLSDYVNLIAKICGCKTKIIAMKGRKELTLTEAEALPAKFKIMRIEDVSVPGVNAERCLVFLIMQGD